MPNTGGEVKNQSIDQSIKSSELYIAIATISAGLDACLVGIHAGKLKFQAFLLDKATYIYS